MSKISLMLELTPQKGLSTNKDWAFTSLIYLGYHVLV